MTINSPDRTEDVLLSSDDPEFVNASPQEKAEAVWSQFSKKNVEEALRVKRFAMNLLAQYYPGQTISLIQIAEILNPFVYQIHRAVCAQQNSCGDLCRRYGLDDMAQMELYRVAAPKADMTAALEKIADDNPAGKFDSAGEKIVERTLEDFAIFYAASHIVTYFLLLDHGNCC